MVRAFAFLILSTLLCSCMQTDNSSALDALTYGGGGSSAVKAIFAQNCVPCHDFQTKSADDLVASGDLIKGDPANSPIYWHLKGSDATKTPQDMPQGGQLSPSDIATIKSWISSL